MSGCCPCTTRIEPGSNPATVDWPTVLPRALSDLDKNGIGDEGLTRLAASLPQLLSLLQLSLLSLNTKTAFPKQLSGFPKHNVA